MKTLYDTKDLLGCLKKSGGCLMGFLKAYRMKVEDSRKGDEKESLSTTCYILPTEKKQGEDKRSQPTTYCLLSSEKGIALVMILILAAIALAIMAGLIYMATSSTQISGMQKRYNTAREAGTGGASIAYQFVALRGDSTDTQSFLTIIKNLCPGDNTANCIKTPSSCTGTEEKTGHTFTGLEAKLRTPSTSWSAACNADNMSIIPSNATSYDMNFDVGESPYPSYRVYAKIVHTMEGNSGADAGLLGSGVVASGSGEVAVVSRPFLYTMEVDTENAANPQERAKLSILYEY